jgi:hypothetical protein
MASVEAPPEVKSSSKSFLIQKIQINDNDAGGRHYTNFTKKIGLLEKIRHLSPTAYRQLIRLANDFQVKGPFISTSPPLSICRTLTSEPLHRTQPGRPNPEDDLQERKHEL